jgi:hypothetical protein
MSQNGAYLYTIGGIIQVRPRPPLPQAVWALCGLSPGPALCHFQQQQAPRCAELPRQLTPPRPAAPPQGQAQLASRMAFRPSSFQSKTHQRVREAAGRGAAAKATKVRAWAGRLLRGQLAACGVAGL